MTAETGVLRNRDDAEGKFMRQTLGDEFFPTSSGYRACITAGGIDLKDGGRPETAWEAFLKLPESARAPNAVLVGELDPVDVKVAPPAPPADGLILKVYARMLRRNQDGVLDYVSVKDFPLMSDYPAEEIPRIGYLFEASVDHVWITAEEWRSAIPDRPQTQQTVQFPSAVAKRICRFHLVPQRIYGEGGEWSPDDVRSAQLSFTVLKISDATIQFRIDGHAELGSEYDASIATTPNGRLQRGYESRFAGYATYDRAQQRFTRCDMISLGDTWGRMGDANGKSVSVERPGRNPLLFAFELVSGERPADCLVPMGRTSKLAGFHYFETGKESENN